MNPEHYRPMSPAMLEPYLEALVDTIDGQPVEVRDRIRLAITSGTYDVVSAGPEGLTLNVRGIGELTVTAVPLHRRADA